MNIVKALFVVAFATALFVFVVWFISQFIKSEIALGLIGFSGAIVTASMQYRAAKDKETSSRLFKEKQEAYSELIELIMGLFQSTKKSDSSMPEDQVLQKLQSIKTRLIVWGSFDTIRTLDQMGHASTTDPAKMLSWLGDLLTFIRKDLGHKDPDKSGTEIAIGLIVADEREGLRNAIAELDRTK